MIDFDAVREAVEGFEAWKTARANAAISLGLSTYLDELHNVQAARDMVSVYGIVISATSPDDVKLAKLEKLLGID